MGETRWLVILGASAVMCAHTAVGQVAGANVVGYMKGVYPAGRHLVVNSFHQEPPRDMVSNLLLPPTGTTVTIWNRETHSFGGSMTFGEYGWSDDFSFPIGSTALLETPTLFTNIWSGEVRDGDGKSLNMDQFLPPSPFEGPAGIHLKGTILPIEVEEGTGHGVFMWVLGREANVDDSITTIDSFSQESMSTRYLGGGVWDNGVPSLEVGQAAFFTLLEEPVYDCLPIMALNPCSNGLCIALDQLYTGMDYKLSYKECLTNHWQAGWTFTAASGMTNVWDLSFNLSASSNCFYKVELMD